VIQENMFFPKTYQEEQSKTNLFNLKFTSEKQSEGKKEGKKPSLMQSMTVTSMDKSLQQVEE